MWMRRPNQAMAQGGMDHRARAAFCCGQAPAPPETGGFGQGSDLLREGARVHSSEIFSEAFGDTAGARARSPTKPLTQSSARSAAGTAAGAATRFTAGAV